MTYYRCDVPEHSGLEAEARRLRESIAAHRAEVLEDLDLQSEENALPADSRLWDVL